MNIKYRQLRAFSLAAQSGSFAKAAERLCISQPSFSILIRGLERDLGVQLFERTTRSCRLTPAGTAFHREISPILQDLDKAYARAVEVGAGHGGQLQISALPSLSFGLVSQVLSDFGQAHSGVRIQMREELNQSLIKSVKSGEVELGVGSQLSGDPDIAFTPLFRDQLMVIAPTGHPILDEPAKWQGVGNYPLIMLAMGSAEIALQQNRPGTRPAVEVVFMGTAVGMVRNGMGITILPSSALKGVDMSGLSALPMPGRNCQRTLGVLFRKRTVLSPAADAFVRLLASAVPAGAGMRRMRRPADALSQFVRQP